MATVSADRLQSLLAERTRATREFFPPEADRLAAVCHRMAERFARGGRLIALGRSPAARSDARHVAVEFVHPVIVGKRALPAIALAGEGGPLETQIGLLAGPDDIAIGFGCGGPSGTETVRALAIARDRGCLTIAFDACGAEAEFVPPSTDPAVRQELVETLYHVLWELVHVFFEHRGLLQGRDIRETHDPGASSFLYPFLQEQESELDPVLRDVARSVSMKAAEIEALREQTIGENGPTLIAAGAALRGCFDAGGKLLALGNGGSATDAMDIVADFRLPAGPLTPRSAIDLTEDPGIITAIANDIGADAVFLRQVIAYGQPGDAVIALTTSGNSANVIGALMEARRRGLVSIALVGYDGGRIAADDLADFVIVTRSEHIPRIQEAQATAYHALRELVG
jgi:D-sedoheptulose 7-phosphate isomerase